MITKTLCLGIVVRPDLSGVKDKSSMPWINNEAIDYECILESINDYIGDDAEDLGVTIRIANDTIDIASSQPRIKAFEDGFYNFCDFGLALERAAKQVDDPVIPVQKHWTELQLIKDRTRCAPPTIIAITMTGKPSSVTICHGLLISEFGFDPQRRSRTLMPLSIKAALESCFSIPFENVGGVIKLNDFEGVAA